MSYTKNTWVDQAGQVRYTETEDDGYKIFTANYEEVTTIGTPVNATNMNHIEDGIKDCDTAITTLNEALTALDNAVVKKAGNQTITDTKTFTGTIKVPNSTYSGTAISLVGRGDNWIKFGDGTMIQWGGASTSNHYCTVNMYQTFTSDYTAYVSDSGSAHSISGFKVYERTDNSKFKVYSDSSGSASAFKWYAIGR